MVGKRSSHMLRFSTRPKMSSSKSPANLALEIYCAVFALALFDASQRLLQLAKLIFGKRVSS
jgi:hypothetical protein